MTVLVKYITIWNNILLAHLGNLYQIKVIIQVSVEIVEFLRLHISANTHHGKVLWLMFYSFLIL